MAMKNFKLTVLLLNALLFFLFLICQEYISPSKEIFVLGVLFCVLSLFFLSVYLHYWSYPLEKILETISLYQEGKFLPRISGNWGRKNPFSKLSFAVNSLTERLHMHIQHSKDKDKEMEGLLDSLNEGVIAFNIRSKVIFVNEMACKMLSVSRETLIGRSLLGLGAVDSLSQKCHEIVIQALQTSELTEQSWSLNNVYFDLVASPLIHQAGAVLVIQDKTSDYKVLEMGKNFVANASHELRTPITIIRGFAEMLQNGSRLSPQTMVDITNKIVKTCDRLDNLVKSLLVIADLEHYSQDRFRPCNISSLIENCKYVLLTAYPNIELTILEEEKEIVVLGDVDLLDLAIMNLLENAVKYSSSPAKIEIQVKESGEFVHIRIQDQGIGIPETDLPHIFDRFYTVDKARSRKSGGAGLGLSIVKTIIEKHEGTVTVESELSKGSVFTLSLRIR
jgi:two-component system, OmpR family, phosphate regulon sensor histidine kinase PhoR